MSSFVFPLLLKAQVNAPAETSSVNTILATVMIIIAVVLAFVIWGMGQVLIILIKQMMEKQKNADKTIALVLMVALMLSSSITFAQTNAVATVAPSSINYGGMNSAGFWTLATVIFFEILAISFLLFFIRRIHQELMPPVVRKPFLLGVWWKKLDTKVFTKAVALEKEADILLDHDYDGIKELDNSLPPWWKYGFIITIVVAVVYLFNFHVLGYGKNPTEEYQAELENAKIEMAEYASKNADKIDEANIQMPLKGGLDEGKAIFASICWSCHGKQGEGGAGPNLTDDYWIHKGALNDIYKSIKSGYPDKGMQSWEKNYSPKQMNNLAGFVKSLRGAKPANPKAPQGDLFVGDSTGVNPMIKDSLIIKTR